MTLRPLAAALVLALCGAAFAEPPPDAGAIDHRDVNLLRGFPNAPRLDGYVKILESPKRADELKIDQVVSSLQLPKNAVLADLGCGPGVFTIPFAQALKDGVVYAVDVEPAQLDLVREKIHTAGLHNVVPVLASYDDPHLPPGRLDVVFMSDAYHHLDDRVAYMKRLQAVLKPGGMVVVVDYKPGDVGSGPPAAHKLKAGEREAELQQAGYVLQKRFTFHAVHDFEIWKPRGAKP